MLPNPSAPTILERLVGQLLYRAARTANDVEAITSGDPKRMARRETERAHTAHQRLSPTDRL